MRLLLLTCLFLATPSFAVEYRFYHPDPLGSNTVVTNRAGEVVQRIVLTPYGETRAAVDGVGSSIDPSADSTRHLFTGQEHDPESDLQYFGARYYDPFVGRFMKQDPVFFSGPGRGLPNGYAYADNRPSVLIDMTGLLPEQPSPTPTAGKETPDEIASRRMRELFGTDDPLEIYDPSGGVGAAAGVTRRITRSALRMLARALSPRRIAHMAANAIKESIKRRGASGLAQNLAQGTARTGFDDLPKVDFLGRVFRYDRHVGTPYRFFATFGPKGDELVAVAQDITDAKEAAALFGVVDSKAYFAARNVVTVVIENTKASLFPAIRQRAKQAGLSTTFVDEGAGALVFTGPVKPSQSIFGF